MSTVKDLRLPRRPGRTPDSGFAEKTHTIRQRRKRWSRYRVQQFLIALIQGLLVIGICFVILYPLFVKIASSFMEERDLYDVTVRLIPRHLTTDNYGQAFQYMDYLRSLRNSLVLCLTTSGLQLASCTLAAYGFARFQFPFKRLLFAFVIMVLVVPPQAIMIPLYLHNRFFDIFGLMRLTTGRTINLMNSFWPFLLSSGTANGLRAGLFIYMLRQYFRGSPKELEEAAYVDGAGSFRTFWRIMLPGAVPMLVTVFLFSFVWQWTDTFYTSLFLTSLKVLPTALSTLAATVAQAYSADMFSGFQYLSPGYTSILNNAGSLLVILPLAVLYIFLQRYFVEGIERSGITGT